jgi:hypothetical protein
LYQFSGGKMCELERSCLILDPTGSGRMRPFTQGVNGPTDSLYSQNRDNHRKNEKYYRSSLQVCRSDVGAERRKKSPPIAICGL